MRLRFESEGLRRDCGSSSRARRRWGSDIALRVAMRLQQLEAMASLHDLAFLPFDHTEGPSGRIEVVVDESLVVVVRPGPVINEEGVTMPTLIVADVRAASKNARAS